MGRCLWPVIRLPLRLIPCNDAQHELFQRHVQLRGPEHRSQENGRVKQGYKASMFMVVVFSLIITSIIFLFGPQLLGLFLKQGAEAAP